MDLFALAQRGLNRTIARWPWLLPVVPLLSGVGLYLFFRAFAEPLRAPFELTLARDLAEGIGTFLTVVGVIYALIIGFTFQQCFARQDDLRRKLTVEASSLRNVLLLCGTLHAWDQRTLLARNLRSYLEGVLEWEFPPRQGRSDDPTQALYDVIPALAGVATDGIADGADQVGLGAIQEEIRTATRARSERLAVSRQQIPRIHWFQIEVLSTLILGGYVLLDMGAPLVEAAVFAATGVAIFVLYLSLFDLDYAFDGLWRVEPIDLVELRDEVVALEVEKPPGLGERP